MYIPDSCIIKSLAAEFALLHMNIPWLCNAER